MKRADRSLGTSKIQLSSVITDRFDRAGIEGFFAKGDLFGGCWLFENERIAVLVVSAKIRRSRIAAHIAIDALPVYVKLTGSVLRQFVFDKSHCLIKIDP